MQFESWQWALAIVGALLVGLSKTGIAGLGLLAVVVFAQLLPAKQATGIVLPLLIVGDVVAVASYHQHLRWRYLGRLFPWTAVGVFAGYFALGWIDDRQARVLVGAIVLGLLALHVGRRWRKWSNRSVGCRAGSEDPALHQTQKTAGSAPQNGAATEEEVAHGAWFAAVIGVLAGFTTLVANAAGPLMILYLLAMRLPKMEFMGTGAVFFLLLNLFKVPFMAELGLINLQSLLLNLWLAPAVLAGGWVGRRILRRIDQRLFENLALLLSAAAGLRLLW